MPREPGTFRRILRWLVAMLLLCAGSFIGLWYFSQFDWVQQWLHYTLPLRPPPRLGLSGIVLVGTIVLIIPLTMLIRSGERRDLLQKCLLFSLVVHVLLAMGFSAVHVSRQIIRYVRHEPDMELPINLEAARVAELQLQVRNQITDISAPVPAVATQAPSAAMDVPLDPRPILVVPAAPAPQRPAAMAIATDLPNAPAPPLLGTVTPALPAMPALAPRIELPRSPQVKAEQPPEPAKSPRPSGAMPQATVVLPAGPIVTAGPLAVRPDAASSLLPQQIPARASSAPDLLLTQSILVPRIESPQFSISLQPATLPAQPDFPLPAAPVYSSGPLDVRIAAGPHIASVPSPVSRAGILLLTAGAVPTVAPRPATMPTIAVAPPAPRLDIRPPLLPMNRPVQEGYLPGGEPLRPIERARTIEVAVLPHELPRPTEIELPLDRVRNSAGSTISAEAQQRDPDALAKAPSIVAPVTPLVDLGPKDLPTPQVLSHRDPEQRHMLAEGLGGTKASEKAVKQSIDYIRRNQLPDGRWVPYFADIAPHKSRQQRNEVAITGLGALCLLAQDHTPTRPGPYQESITRALKYLHDMQERNGNTRGEDGDMYDQAIATIALAEAAIMTRDETYRLAAKRAADYIVDSRNQRTGAWRYLPYSDPDMSVTGWQIMALHSAEEAGWTWPAQHKRQLLEWIDSISSGRYRMLASYRPGMDPTPTMTAQATFSRILLGQKLSDAQIKEACDFVTKIPADQGELDFYHLYCVSLMLMQFQNPAWEQWNARMQQHLLKLQRQDASAQGSWDPDQKWSDRGGRMYSTALATLTLQVYYRYLPMYAGKK